MEERNTLLKTWMRLEIPLDRIDEPANFFNVVLFLASDNYLGYQFCGERFAPTVYCFCYQVRAWLSTNPGSCLIPLIYYS